MVMETPKKETATNYEFKFLYAIGIIAVVAAHCENGGISMGYEFFAPAGFCLPLFMFASGYFYRHQEETSVGKSIWRKFKKLIVPMYIWNLVYGLVVLFLSNVGFTIGKEFNLYNLLAAPWVDGNQFQYNMGGWYLVPLFMVYVLNLCLRKLLGKKGNDYILLVLYLIFGCFGIYGAWHGYNHGIGLALIRMAYFLPFYGFGTLYKSKLEGRIKIGNLIYFGVLFVAQLLIISKYKQAVSYTYSWCNNFDNLYLPFIVPLLGIMFWVRIAKILSPILAKCKYVLLIANNTYAITIHQFLGFMLVKLMFGIVHTMTEGTFFMAFSWESFKSDIWYYYLPGGIGQWRIVYQVAAIVIPILLQCVLNRCGAFIKKTKVK